MGEQYVPIDVRIPPPEPVVEQEDNHEKVLSKRHRQAVISVEFENFLKNRPDLIERENTPEEFDTIMDGFLASVGEEISQGLRRMFEGIFSDYHYIAKKAHKVFGVLKEQWVEKVESAEALSEQVGKYIFKSQTKKDPVKPVTFEEKIGHCILYCSGEDYLIFKEDDKNTSEGTHYRSYVIPALKGVPLILIRGEKSSVPDVEIAAVEAHEEQHFINHAILDRFDPLERAYGAKPVPFLKGEHEIVSENLRESHLGLKDEILAFLKDGTPGQEIPDILVHYKKFYTQLEPAEVNALKLQLREIGKALEKYSHIFSAAPAVLVYHLVDIPFQHIGEYVEKIGQWYQDKFVDWQPATVDFLEFTEYPTAYGKAKNDAIKNAQEFNQVLPKVFRTMLLNPGMKLSDTVDSDILQAKQAYEDSKQALYRNDTHVPYVVDATKTVELTENDSNKVTALLDSLCESTDQSDIVELYRFLRSNPGITSVTDDPHAQFLINLIEKTDLHPISLSTKVHDHDEPGVLVILELLGPVSIEFKLPVSQVVATEFK